MIIEKRHDKEIEIKKLLIDENIIPFESCEEMDFRNFNKYKLLAKGSFGYAFLIEKKWINICI
jgi:hypothetical protein